MTKKQARANAAARLAGFRNDYHYRQARKANPALSRALAAAGPQLPPRARRELVSMRANVMRAPGRKGSKARARYFARLAEYLRRAGVNPSKYFAALGSPKRKKR